MQTDEKNKMFIYKFSSFGISIKYEKRKNNKRRKTIELFEKEMIRTITKKSFHDEGKKAKSLRKASDH